VTTAPRAPEQGRAPGAGGRPALLVVDDDPLITDTLAFALGPIPHLEPVQRPVPFLEPEAGPISGNVDAETTAAFFQFVPDGVIGIPPTPGCLVLSTRARFEGHYCAQDAAEAREQRLGFFESALVGVPEIRNPFAP